MTRTWTSIFLVLALFAGRPALAAEPSRAPDQGCSWENFESASLGIRLLVENCSDPRMHYVFSAKGDWLEQHRPSDDTTFGSHQIIRVMTKPADQPIEAAIRQQFIATLADKRARASCRVAEAKNTGVRGPGKILLEIVPSGAYARMIARRLRAEPRDFGCGGSNTIVLGGASDTSSDTLMIGGASNTITVNGSGNNQVTTVGGINTITVGSSGNTITLGEAAGGSPDTLTTAAGGNTVFVSAAAITTLNGAMTSGDGTTNRLVLTAAGTMSPVKVSGLHPGNWRMAGRTVSPSRKATSPGFPGE